MGADGTRSETSLELSLLDALLAQRHMAVGVCDSDGALVMTSPAMEQLLGAGYDPIPADEWSAAYYLHDELGNPLPPREDPLAKVLDGRPVVNEVLSIRRSREPVRWGLASGIQLLDENEDAIGAAVFVLDVTERAVEQQRLDDLRERLVQTVNHEVRTPIAKMQGHLELLEEQVAGMADPVRWSFAAMHRAADRLAEVAETISDLAEQPQRVVPD